MKLWVDDVRPAPKGHVWAKSVWEAKSKILYFEWFNKEFHKNKDSLDVIDIDYDIGDYANDGVYYSKLIDWLEETGRNYPIHIHSISAVSAQNICRIIQRNGWKEV